MTAPHEQEDTKRMLADGYNKSADRYLAWIRSRKPGWDHRLQLLEKLYGFMGIADGVLKSGVQRKTVLEIGCGAGDPVTLALAAHPQIERVVGNDISSTQLSMLRESLDKVEESAAGAEVQLVESDMMGLNFAAQSFDAVVAFYSTIHLERNEQTEIVRRCYGWLKGGQEPGDGGFLLCCFAVEANAGKVNNDWLGMRSYWSGWGAEKSLAVVEKTGFEVVFQEVAHDPEDAPFLWVIARKKAGA